MIINPLFNPNRYVIHTDDINGVQRVNMGSILDLPGVQTFYTRHAPLPVTCPVVYADRFTSDTMNPANTVPNYSDEVFN